MSADLPENVERLVAVGLETCQAEDRLLALGLANQEDKAHQFQSQFGVEVAGIFLRQLGLSLEPNGQRIKRVKTWTREDMQTAIIMQQIDKALGGQLATHSSFYRLIKDTEEGSDEVIIASEEKFIRMLDPGFIDEKPFLVTQQYLTDTSQRNFNTAISAILGMSGVRESLDDSRFDGALERIRGLDDI